MALATKAELMNRDPQELEEASEFWGRVFEGLNLSPKMKRYVQAVVECDGDENKAALLTFSDNPNSAKSMTSFIRKTRVDVQRAIDRAMCTIGLTPENILRRINVIANDEERGDTRLKALVALGKASGLFNEKSVHAHFHAVKVDWAGRQKGKLV